MNTLQCSCGKRYVVINERDIETIRCPACGIFPFQMFRADVSSLSPVQPPTTRETPQTETTSKPETKTKTSPKRSPHYWLQLYAAIFVTCCSLGLLSKAFRHAYSPSTMATVDSLLSPGWLSPPIPPKKHDPQDAASSKSRPRPRQAAAPSSNAPTKQFFDQLAKETLEQANQRSGSSLFPGSTPSPVTSTKSRPLTSHSPHQPRTSALDDPGRRASLIPWAPLSGGAPNQNLPVPPYPSSLYEGRAHIVVPRTSTRVPSRSRTQDVLEDILARNRPSIDDRPAEENLEGLRGDAELKAANYENAVTCYRIAIRIENVRERQWRWELGLARALRFTEKSDQASFHYQTAIRLLSSSKDNGLSKREANDMGEELALELALWNFESLRYSDMFENWSVDSVPMPFGPPNDRQLSTAIVRTAIGLTQTDPLRPRRIDRFPLVLEHPSTKGDAAILKAHHKALTSANPASSVEEFLDSGTRRKLHLPQVTAKSIGPALAYGRCHDQAERIFEQAMSLDPSSSVLIEWTLYRHQVPKIIQDRPDQFLCQFDPTQSPQNLLASLEKLKPSDTDLQRELQSKKRKAEREIASQPLSTKEKLDRPTSFRGTIENFLLKMAIEQHLDVRFEKPRHAAISLEIDTLGNRSYRDVLVRFARRNKLRIELLPSGIKLSPIPASVPISGDTI